MDKTLLVVEDDRDILALIEWHIKAEGFRVLTETDGEKGLKAALREKPDLIVLDLMLPGLDGLAVQAASKKRRNRPYSRAHAHGQGGRNRSGRRL